MQWYTPSRPPQDGPILSTDATIPNHQAISTALLNFKLRETNLLLTKIKEESSSNLFQKCSQICLDHAAVAAKIQFPDAGKALYPLGRVLPSLTLFGCTSAVVSATSEEGSFLSCKENEELPTFVWNSILVLSSLR